MNILSRAQQRIVRLTAHAELNVDAGTLPSAARELSDPTALDVVRDLAAVINDLRRVQAVVAGVIAERSRREHGQTGLAATQGHATPASLIQSITGGTRDDAHRQVRVGASLLEAADDAGSGGPGGDGTAGEGTAGDGAAPGGAGPLVWHASLGAALLAQEITAEQHDAIRRGLGEPPIGPGRATTDTPDATDQARNGADTTTDDRIEAATTAWSLAAASLAAEAATMTTEDLLKAARTMRDMLDPVGAEERFARRFEKRSFRTWTDSDGQHHGHIVFDDEMALWVESLTAAALRPRRGGPRFVTAEERTQAETLLADPRTNEQLQYDLLVDLIRAGAAADAKDVFGARQPGVRLVVIAAADEPGPRDAPGRILATGHAEDGGAAVPGSVIDRSMCANGTRRVHLDGTGDPLDLGRTTRLYSAPQKLAISLRDGGCMARACGAPASFCEVHHIDPYSEGGRTDIDRGILLCRFHHMTLHNHGARITRAGKGAFVWHPRAGDGDPHVLTSKARWKQAWDPPRPPARATWREGPRTVPV